ncbi:MAG: nicotinate-nucleotide diphosphorylase (carboxylating) [Cryomorphaceae bacterium]|jgi:nicotinate-nucleotide pyrophosphorylase (carboxylating)|nr:nicotinate-nucleotide diphosphorylase (carboxylating) [Cryomorphaceae bacterium]
MIDDIILNALKEDIGEGDHSSLSCLQDTDQGTAKLLVKENGVLAGVEIAKRVFELYDSNLEIEVFIHDGAEVKVGDIALEVRGKAQSILSTERLVLNIMQRMSGIATKTRKIVNQIKGTGAHVLDTRKTTPGIRQLEKMAVVIGGGMNHRFGLYDMIMLKDNHIDFVGGVRNAIEKTTAYVQAMENPIDIEIEIRTKAELMEAISTGGIQRILLDNFTPEVLKELVTLIPDSIESEASGGITESSVRAFAETGVDFISMGALTHSVKSLDLSLKAYF